jgi:hypothetical protein
MSKIDHTKEYKDENQVVKAGLVMFDKPLSCDKTGRMRPPHYKPLSKGIKGRRELHALSRRYAHLHINGSGKAHPDGTFSVSQILCHDYEQGHTWVLVSWVGYNKPTWEMAKNMPIMKMVQYGHWGPVILSTYMKCREVHNITLYGEDEITTEDEESEGEDTMEEKDNTNDEEDEKDEEEEEEEDEENEENEETVTKLTKSIYGKKLVD